MPPSAKLADGARTGRSASTREEILTAIRRWNDLFGEPPCTADWNPSVARWRAQEWRIERYAAGDPDTGARWPSLNAVKRRFDGSFDAAVREAGLVPRRPGPRRRAPGTARPDVPPREPLPPVALDDALRAAHALVAAADARAAEAERRAEDALRRARAERARADREQARAAESRLRARRLADRARRAIEARDRARERELRVVAAARAACEDRLAAARADADQRIAAARAREQAASRRADRAEEGAARLVAATGDPTAPAGPAVLAAALTRLARARAAGGAPGDLRGALREVSLAASRWAQRL
ncbi:hypothetical protein [Paraconexibacter algicola]|uniref:Uncharacterized protein n=1 Tax=Paraconexibacter algicola TaxID=2133960 RepID=A0A2T4UHS7_9ACTN|nr:hypothetical protein [Paraconexibacter algicola]PTL58769.1 hypothetical protein C7Y72_03450 [Paraconexibacter algicola]